MIYRFGDCELDTQRFELRREGVVRPVEPQVLRLLAHLIENRHRVVTRAELYKSVWSGRIVAEAALYSRIKSARDAIGDHGRSQSHIRTVSRMGYQFVAELEEPQGEATGAGKAMPASRATPPLAAPAEAVSIAVLPFVNLSSDQAQEYFSDGLTEDLINQLARIRALRVAGRTSSFAFKGRNESFRVIGAQLGVNHVLEGSVRRVGQRLRITTQLIKCSDGYHLWSERFDREATDVFAIQDEIALAVANALRVTLRIGEPVRSPGATDNLAAYDKYLRARALFHQSGPSELSRAIEIYREALALDPRFALAWYGLYAALEYALAQYAESAAKTRKEMEHVAVRLVELAPDAWWTHAMRARQLMLQHRWADAEAAVTATLTAAPASEIDALTTHATFLMTVGRVGEAVASYQRARRADPLSLRVSGFLQLFLDMTGARDEAQAEFERCRDLAGGHFRWEWAAILRAWSRENADVAVIASQFRRFLQRHRKDMSGKQLAFHTSFANAMTDSETARAVLHQAFDDPELQDAGCMTMVFLYADHVGDKDLALAALRRAIVNYHKSNLEGLWWPSETRLRADPRFKQLVRDIGLANYWRASGKWGDFARPVGEDDFELYR